MIDPCTNLFQPTRYILGGGLGSKHPWQQGSEETDGKQTHYLENKLDRKHPFAPNVHRDYQLLEGLPSKFST